MTFDAYDVVVVPFPFTDRRATKRRPALVVSRADTFGSIAGHSVLAMITTSQDTNWPLDVPIDDLEAAQLPTASFVRMKLFTLDHRLILRNAGRLGRADRKKVQEALQRLLGI